MGGDCGQSPVPSVGDLSYGGGRPGRARPTATSAQPIATQPRPRTNNVLKKKDCFFLIFLTSEGPGWLPVDAPDVVAWRAGRSIRRVR